ncbi:hypothetical protein GCM10009624_21380 [Gordonia sinesedis]
MTGQADDAQPTPHPATLDVDVDTVTDVAGFYRRAALVADAAAADLSAHDLGSWAVGENYRALGERYAEMGRAMAGTLRRQATATARLADVLHSGVAGIVAADDEQARAIGAAASRASTPHPRPAHPASP